MARSSKVSPIGIIALIILAIIGLAIQYWYFTVPVLIALLAVAAWSRKTREREARAQTHKADVIKLAQKLQKDLQLATTGKSLETRLGNCSDALNILGHLDEIDRDSNIVTNKAEIRAKVQLLQKILPVLKLVEKSNKYYFTDEKKKELKSLKEILYYVHTNQITDSDLQQLDVRNESTGTVATVAEFEARIKKLDQIIAAKEIA